MVKKNGNYKILNRWVLSKRITRPTQSKILRKLIDAETLLNDIIIFDKSKEFHKGMSILEQIEASLTNGKWVTRKEADNIRRFP